jgi:hypothetical protein
VLAGPGVAWVEREQAGAALWETESGGSPTRVQGFPRDGTERVAWAPMAGSARLVAVAVLGVIGTGQDAHLAGAAAYAGPWGKQLTMVRERCEDADSPVASIDASGDTVAHFSCAGGSVGPFVFDDFSTDPPRSESTDVGGLGARIAGRFLAFLDGAQAEPTAPGAFPYGVSVYDRVSHQIVYHVPADSLGSGVRNLDVQDDGKVAIAYVDPLREGEQPHTRIGWASIDAPTLHPLPIKRAGSYNVRIAGNVIAFERGLDSSGEFTPASVGLVALDGKARVVARNGEASVALSSFDYDGSRLAWWSYGCRKPKIEHLSASARSGPGLNRRGCKLRLRRPPAVIHGKRVRLHVDCFGFYDCSVSKLTITLPRRPRTLIATGRGSSARLTAFGRSLLRRRSRLEVRVQATITDAAGRREHRAARLTLHR